MGSYVTCFSQPFYLVFLTIEKIWLSCYQCYNIYSGELAFSSSFLSFCLWGFRSPEMRVSHDVPRR